MKNKVSTYWLCQIGGWGVNAAVNIFFYLTLAIHKVERFYLILFISIFLGVIFTHLMRNLIIKFNVLNQPLKKQIFWFLIFTLIFSIAYAATDVGIEKMLGLKTVMNPKISLLNELIRTFISYFFIILIWNLIYFVVHYVERNTKNELDSLRLQSLIKELELKTIKSHINPHFIFNALNSIRALVDENPSRARTAITELSNILRSSMQAEKLETVTLETELNIVRDYLALEQMRFEERLRVEMDIDEDTLDQTLPPMVLQTIVENAIKHGISKNINGGLVKIKIEFVDDHMEISVKNTGQVNGILQNGDGFGLRSINERLKLLYQDKAAFEIKNYNAELVESKIILPIKLI